MRVLVQQRERRFLSLVEQSIFGFPHSPYVPLFRHAGIEFDDVARWVSKRGLPESLERLHEAGVYLTLNEFKGRQPIRRGSLEYQADYADFDNPVGGSRFVARTSGSRGARHRMPIDLQVLSDDACYHRLFVEAFGIERSPVGIWRTGPPDASGTRNALVYAKTGQPVERWFAQNRLAEGPGGWKNALFAFATSAAAAATGCQIPIPTFQPLDRAVEVTRWLADHAARGRPGHLNTLVGSALRVCLAARAEGLDISGSVFRVGSEPLTPTRFRLLEDAGVRVASHYAMTEVGVAAMACAEGTVPDEAHVLQGKVALTARPVRIRSSGEPVNAFFITTVHPSSPKLMLNVETGDHGHVTASPCGCPFGEAALDQRVHSILSYEKLTSEGMTFLGTDLWELLEQVLPKAFGGAGTDYQLVEQDANGLPAVSLFVSPRLGPLDEASVLRTTRSFLARGDAGRRLMTGVWNQGETLRLVRREPLTTEVGKILPLHVEQSGH